MLAKRIIPCLDVRDGRVVKGIQFKNHKDMGGIVELTLQYQEADELVFYDISASTKDRSVEIKWVEEIAKNIGIPFCVAGGIKSIEKAREILYQGADKISINTPALINPSLITGLTREFGSQAVVVGIDSRSVDGEYRVFSHSGDEKTIKMQSRLTLDWAQEVEDLGAGEIVVNCISQDGMRRGYDIVQLAAITEKVNVPVVASGGAGRCEDFLEVFKKTSVTGALAASVFHSGELSIHQVRHFLSENDIPMRKAI